MSVDIVVLKYGGTSLGDLGRFKAVAQSVARRYQSCSAMIIVVSAMAGHTDNLLETGRSLNESTSPATLREMDALAGTGEQVSAALLALALQKAGVPARSLTAHQVRIATDSRFQRARIKAVESKSMLDCIKHGIVCVVAGFQGIDGDGNLVTLGRGGSDTSAVAVSIAVGADSCEIFTDVDGIYTTDPRVVPKARKLRNISFEEMLELASTGAKVMQLRSVELAMKNHIRLCIRSSFSEEQGTMIFEIAENAEGPVVTALSHDLRQAKVSVIGLPGGTESLTTALKPLAEEDISVDFITQNFGADGRMSLSFTIVDGLVEQAVRSLREHLCESQFPDLRIEVDNDLAKVSAVGIGMRSHAGVAYRFFSSLTKNGIPIYMALSTEIKVSCMIRTSDCSEALNVLHEEFFGI